MKKQVISIVTEQGAGYGTGHLQRMMLLSYYINRNTEYTSEIICSSETPVSQQNNLVYKKAVDPASVCIIRDMRDSGTEQIKQLQNIAPVAVVDDAGSGRSKADLVVDLLPNLLHAFDSSSYHPECYIYGYDFFRSLTSVTADMCLGKPAAVITGGGSDVHKTIDLAVYFGADTTDPCIQGLISSWSEHYVIAVLMGRDSYIIQKRTVRNDIDLDYASILLSATVLITYFGLTLFDGLACGCNIITINPGTYHAELSDLVSNERVVNAGVYQDVTPELLLPVVSEMINLQKCSIDRDKIKNTIFSGLEAFISLIHSRL